LRKTLEAMDRHNIVLGFLSGADLGIVKDWASAEQEPERRAGCCPPGFVPQQPEQCG
jgi:hypothetical protein